MPRSLNENVHYYYYYVARYDILKKFLLIRLLFVLGACLDQDLDQGLTIVYIFIKWWGYYKKYYYSIVTVLM